MQGMGRNRLGSLVFGIAAAVLIGSAGVAAAAEATAITELNSAYVFRGVTLNDGWVVQPSIDVSKTGFSVNVWGNLDIDDYDGTFNKGEFSEVDLLLQYEFGLGPMTYTAGIVQYLYPHQEDENGRPLDGTREVFASAEMEILAGLALGLSFYYDVDEIHDFYSNLYATYETDVAKIVTLEFGASAGYVGKDESVGGERGFDDYNFSLAAKREVIENLELAAKIAYTGSIDRDVLPDQDVHTYGGVSASYAF
jgi:uncharacterized protein (TIGR02001 family)